MKQNEIFEASILGSSVKMLDDYIESKKQYLFITTCFHIIHEQKVYDIHFVLSNKMPVDKKIIPTYITMTEFKKLYNDEYCNCKNILDYKNRMQDSDRRYAPKLSVPVFDFLNLFYIHFQENYDKFKQEDLIFFDNPISINAQSSKNRTGYGNEYYYDLLVHEGTKYGETNEFPIIGYTCSLYGRIDDRYLIKDNRKQIISPRYLL